MNTNVDMVAEFERGKCPSTSSLGTVIIKLCIF